MRCSLADLLLLSLACLKEVQSFAANNNGKSAASASLIGLESPATSRIYPFSIPLANARPKPESILGTLNELWNDPRPVTSLIGNDRSVVGNLDTSESPIPYCIVSDPFELEENIRFQILLYPRGRFVGKDGNYKAGPAAAFLRYLPNEYGDEVDIAWKLRLVDTRSEKSLPILTSGGLPKSKDTWSSAMTFCVESEAIESVGRATDWGASTWFSQNVCDALGHIKAEGQVQIFDFRQGETMFAWPPGSKGGIGAVQKAAQQSVNNNGIDREFRVGEVIVSMGERHDASLRREMEQSFVYPGIDYRIMTMTDKDGNPIFSTKSLSKEDRLQAKLALRPCGWKMQQQVWQSRGMTTDWPVQVSVGLLESRVLTRFNPGSAWPRITSAFARDWVTYTLGIALAIAPIPAALVARNVVSFYAIPSASMEPTLRKGDVLLVEKLPGTFSRTRRGDVVLFNPPESLRNLIQSTGGSSISGTSLFVKRVVGLPGDRNLKMDSSNNEVSIEGQRVVGPDRDMCEDEPLRLIERLLAKGQGKEIDELGPNDVYVLGDCKAVSVDSRVFGVLPKEDIVGRPLARIWPLSRFTTDPL